jgi:UrcA family protein
MIRTFSIATVLTLTMACAAQVQAQDYDVARTAPVKLSDLNLNDPRDAKVALRRLDSAAEQVCNNIGERYSLRHAAMKKECMATTVATAVNDAKSLQLSLALAQRTGAQPVTVAGR